MTVSSNKKSTEHQNKNEIEVTFPSVRNRGVVETSLQKVESIDKFSLYSNRALKAGYGGKSVLFQRDQQNRADTNITVKETHNGTVAPFLAKASVNLAGEQKPNKYLVIGDGLLAPFLALCLRVNGVQCDLAHHLTLSENKAVVPEEYSRWTLMSDMDRGTICLTPSVTQLMGDVFELSVPSGSIIGRILTFDHVGNDMCDIDLNEFREKGESPTFFCCERLKIEQSLISLCENGVNACNVLSRPDIPKKGGLEALPEGGVRVFFSSGTTQDYLGVICTARNENLIPEMTASEADLLRRIENEKTYEKALQVAPRWMEMCVPPLPELRRHEKRFTPGSQEIVEIITPRGAKMIVRPTMLTRKLFYNVNFIIPKEAKDPRPARGSTNDFWDDVTLFWTQGQSGYISHTTFKAMMSHLQDNLVKARGISTVIGSNALLYQTPLFTMPYWAEGGDRLIRIGHAAHGSCFDAVDISDAQGFTDCFIMARALAECDSSAAISRVLEVRKAQVTEEMVAHRNLIDYTIKERMQLSYMKSRFSMKLLGKYKKNWRSILKNYVSMVKK